MPVIRVVPDVPAVDRPFDYLAEDHLEVGTIVRVPLGGRRVRGWVVESGVEPETALQLRQIVSVVGCGPSAEVIELCRWAAWRWSGRLATMLRLASPNRVVRTAPRALESRRGVGLVDSITRAQPDALVELSSSLVRSAVGPVVLQVAPTTDPIEIALAASTTGQALVVVPSPALADRITRTLRSRGLPVARWPHDWSQAVAGANVVGGRGSVFASASDLSAIVVIDEHDQRHQNEGSPTWNARDIAVHRAAGNAIACILVSPVPSLEALVSPRVAAPGSSLAASIAGDPPEPQFVLSRKAIRTGWAAVRVIDRRGEDSGRSGLFSSDLVGLMRDSIEADRPVLCVLNRTGRAKLLSCRSCSTLAACHECGAALTQPVEGSLLCPRCGTGRPALCVECGSTALALLRPGVTRAREELEALLRTPVDMVTAATPSTDGESALVTIGTTAVLNRRLSAGLVAFVDFDQELLSSRYRAAEDALTLLMEASRLVHGREGSGTVAVQTRMPEHEVIIAATRADPRVVSEHEWRRRRLLGLPPLGSVAVIGREGAPEFVERMGDPDGVSITGVGDGRWLARSLVAGRLQDVLGEVDRPAGRLQLQVDPHGLGG